MVHHGRKFSQPQLPPIILFRETLIRKLEDALTPPADQQSAACKLVLLRAPAGYGKTTLLADFARRSQIPFGWYFLDREDVHLLVFLETLTTIFCEAFPDIEQTLHPMFLQDLAIAIQSRSQQQYEQALNTYATTLERHISHSFILCFCDYHEVNENECIQMLLNHLLKKMPSKLSLVIESRAVPSLELAPLLARRQILGLGSNVLGFSAQEIREFSRLQQSSPITEEEAEQLTSTFGGWIAGMLLDTRLGDIYASQAVNSSDVSWGSPAFFTDQSTLLSYVKNEVFAKEPQAFTFLQETSLLPHLIALHCNHLLQIEHAEQSLSHIERQGLFIARVDSKGSYPTYVLHPVLRQLLYEDLHRMQPERATFLHRRAATLFYSWSDYVQALTHAKTAQDYSMMVDILMKAASLEQEKQMEQEALAYWIDILPHFIREQHPRLLLLRATIHLTQHEYLQAAPLLEQAYRLVAGYFSSIFDGDTSPTLQAEITLARSRILFEKGNYIQAQQLCSEALASLPADETALRISAFVRLGVCKTLLGDCTDGISTLQQAFHLSGHTSTTPQTAYIHSCLANSYSLICNYALAEYHRAQAIALYERLNDTRGKTNNLIWMAILKRNKGAFQEAETMLQNIIIVARQENFQSGEAYALFNLGANYVDTNSLPQALVSLESSLKIARQMGDGRLTDQCLCELAMTYLLMEDSHTAQLLLAQTMVASTEQTGYETLGYELVHSTVLLYQQNFETAYTCFRTLEPLAQRARLKRVHIECLIRLAVCQYKLSWLGEMEASMEKVVELVTQGHFEHIPLIELRRFPQVWQVVQKFPDKACINTWRDMSNGLGEEEEIQEYDTTSVQQKSSFECPSKAKLHIHAFGEPTVIIDGVPITRWQMVRSMEMFFFLLEYQRPIRKEQLVEALWPEDEEYIDQTFRSALHYLRKAIGGICITSHGGVYTLDLRTLYGDDVWSDVALFQYHHTKAKETLDTGQDEKAMEHLQTMVELYRGDYVQSFYSSWCTLRRDDLRRLYLDARQELARLTWNSGQFEESVHHWQHMIAVDACSEEAHYGLMHCYARLGKRSLAMRQYQRCAEIMERELAISPGPALQKLYRQLTM